jgi:hypothetical protein
MWPYGQYNAPLLILIYRIAPVLLIMASLWIAMLGAFLMGNTPVDKRKNKFTKPSDKVEHIFLSMFKD